MTLQPTPLTPPPEDATESLENAIELKEVEGLSQGQIVFRRFVRHRGAMIAAVVLFLVILLATTSIGVGPFHGWWQWDYIRKHDIAIPGGRPTLVISLTQGIHLVTSRSVRTPSDGTSSPG